MSILKIFFKTGQATGKLLSTAAVAFSQNLFGNQIRLDNIFRRRQNVGHQVLVINDFAIQRPIHGYHLHELITENKIADKADNRCCR